MKRFVIERHIPGIGRLNAAQFNELAAASNGAVAKLARKVQWVHSYVAGDNTFCVYLGDSEDAVREHVGIEHANPARCVGDMRLQFP